MTSNPSNASSSPLRAEIIAPFVQAAVETLSTMAGIKVQRKSVTLKKGYQMHGEISGVIGLSGKTAGTCAVSLPLKAAVHVIESLICETLPPDLDQQVLRDGVGELINMIAGRAKAILSTTPYKFDITLPTIISGANHEVFHRKGTHCVVVIFEMEDGQTFALDVCVSAN